MSKYVCAACDYAKAYTRKIVGVGASSHVRKIETEYICQHPALIPAGEVVIFKGITSPKNCPLKWKCRVCGCTWNNACKGGCYWLKKDLCSTCATIRREG